MKRPTTPTAPKTVAEPLALVLAEVVPTLDPKGLEEDAGMLTSSGWTCDENVEDHATFLKSNGTLKLTCGQDDDMPHRLKWELTIHANNTQVGYALIVLRPGDMNGSTVGRLIKEAVEVAEAEFRKWSDALAEARSILQA